MDAPAEAPETTKPRAAPHWSRSTTWGRKHKKLNKKFKSKVLALKAARIKSFYVEQTGVLVANQNESIHPAVYTVRTFVVHHVLQMSSR